MECRRGLSCWPAAAAAASIHVLVERGVPGAVAVDGEFRRGISRRGVRCRRWTGPWDVASSVCRQVLQGRVRGRAGIVGFPRGETVGWVLSFVPNYTLPT